MTMVLQLKIDPIKTKRGVYNDIFIFSVISGGGVWCVCVCALRESRCSQESNRAKNLLITNVHQSPTISNSLL